MSLDNELRRRGTRNCSQREMCRVLVTGSAGFIGGYLVEELLVARLAVKGWTTTPKYGPM